MNEQKAPKGIEWTRLPKKCPECYGSGLVVIERGDDAYDEEGDCPTCDGIGMVETDGYTWNPVAGCLHGCKWTMPDGQVAECYAKSVAERLAVSAYPHGFEHHYWHPERLEEPLKVKEEAGIFLDSMSDLMGRWVPDEQVQAVLDVCREAHWHTFMLLTKNAPRLRKFRFPPNVWVGVSSPPDFMYGEQLTQYQKEKMLRTALGVLEGVSLYGHMPNTTWMSFEPLSWDLYKIVAGSPNALDWAVIGAASNGAKKYAPDEGHLRTLVEVLDNDGVPIFFKGNMKSSEWARENWREEFPKGEWR